MALETVLEARSWEPTIAGRTFRLEEFTPTLLRRYLARLDELVEVGRAKGAEAALQSEHGLMLSLLGAPTDGGPPVDEAWAEEKLVYSIRLKILAGVDELNSLNERISVGNALSPLAGATPGPESSTE